MNRPYLTQTFANRRLLTKMVLINLVVILPLVIASVFAYSSYSKSIEKNIAKYQQDVVRELTINLDTYMNELSLLTTMPYQSPDMMRFLAARREGSAPLTLEESDTVGSFINRIMVNGRVNVVSLYMYGSRGTSYVLLPESIATTNRKLKDEPWYGRLSASSGLVFIGPHEVKSSNGVTSRVITAARKIRSIQTGQQIGFFALDVSVSAIENKAGAQHSGSNPGTVAIMDDTGAVVYKDKEMALAGPEIAPFRGEGSLVVRSNGKRELLTYYTSQLTGWTTVGTVPMSLILNDAVQVRNNSVLLGIGCLLLAILISVWLSFFITRPISQLRNLMKKVERGDISVSIPLRSRDEVGQLSQSFNVMVSRLSDLGYKLYETELREKDSQLAALQNQINPHFLYNTLGSISMYAEIQGNREVVHMTNHLSDLLRYSINSSESEVPLAHELGHVNGYMAIQMIRYENKLNYVVDVDPKLHSNLIIRLSLQPIVENCIIHGFEQARGRGTIRIAAQKLEQSMLVTIEDDGKGMKPQELQSMQDKLFYAPLPAGDRGHGIVNVHRRIVLRYGPKYGLEIQSEPMKGTKVSLVFPILLEDNTGKEDN